MAWNTINWSCGHSDQKQLYGKIKDRERYVAWAESSGLCEDCRASNETARINHLEAELELAPLTGSDKQIAWARKIRAQKINEVVARIAAMRSRIVAGKEGDFEKLASTVMTGLASIDQAKFWIENRDGDENSIMRQVIKK